MKNWPLKTLVFALQLPLLACGEDKKNTEEQDAGPDTDAIVEETVDEILAAAEQTNADLIVMVTEGLPEM